MDWSALLTCLLSSITTIIVAALGLSQSKKTKESEKYRKLREQIETQEKEAAEKKEQENIERLETIEKSISGMKSDIDELKINVRNLTNTDLTQIENQLSNLHTLQADNFSYIQSLSNVVLTMGESLNASDAIDVKDKDKMKEMIDRHRAAEQEISKKLYKIIT